MQDLAASQAINAQLLGAQQAGQGLATDVLRADIARQQANVATGLQAGTFNVEAALRAAQANQQTGLQASQANQDAFLRAALANQQTGLQAALANQQTGLQAALANQQAGMQADQFNIQNVQDVGRFNIQTGLDASRFNADAANRFAEANRGFNYTAQQVANGAVACGSRSGTGVTSVTTNTGSSMLFNGCWLTIEVPLPTDYDAATPPGMTQPGWWRIRYNMGGSASDTAFDLSTWQVSIRGNPVHLVP